MICIFCSIVAGGAPGHILFQNEYVVVFLSLEGHPLIAPLKHISSLEQLDDETSAEIFKSAKRVSSATRAATGCDGVNLVLSDGQAAGQDVFHLHVKPRWHGDDVKLSWNTDAAPEANRSALADGIRKQLLVQRST